MTPDQADSVKQAIRRVERSVARYSRSDAQDIVQEALARAVRHGVALDSEPWLRTVARRIAIDRSRRARELASGATDDLDQLGAPTVTDPAETVVANEGYGVLHKVLNSMPTRYRDVLLSYAEVQETDDVAQRFGISGGAARTLLSRARTRLRQELDHVGYALGAIGVRLQRWQVEATTAGAVLCIAVAASLPATQPARSHLSDARPKTTASSTTTKSATSAVTGGGTSRVPTVRATIPKAADIARYKVGACGPSGNRVPVAADVYIQRDANQSLTGNAVEGLPQSIREQGAGTC